MERFWEKVDLSGDCWLWTAADNGAGYGVFRLSDPRRMVLAHRFAYELLVGPIPEGMEIDHLCRTPRCVNPDHLEPVTHRENDLRGSAAITYCPQGHPYTDENTYVVPSTGWRQCRECHRERDRLRSKR